MVIPLRSIHLRWNIYLIFFRIYTTVASNRVILYSWTMSHQQIQQYMVSVLVRRVLTLWEIWQLGQGIIQAESEISDQKQKCDTLIEEMRQAGQNEPVNVEVMEDLHEKLGDELDTLRVLKVICRIRNEKRAEKVQNLAELDLLYAHLESGCECHGPASPY